MAHKCLRLAHRSQKTRSEWWYLALCQFGKEFFEMHAKTRRMRKKLKTFRPTKAYRAKYVKAMLHYASQCQKMTRIIDKMSWNLLHEEFEQSGGGNKSKWSEFVDANRTLADLIREGVKK